MSRQIHSRSPHLNDSLSVSTSISQLFLPCPPLVLQFGYFAKPPLSWQSAFIPRVHCGQSGRLFVFTQVRIIPCTPSVKSFRICLLLMYNCCNLNGKINNDGVRKPRYLQNRMQREENIWLELGKGM